MSGVSTPDIPPPDYDDDDPSSGSNGSSRQSSPQPDYPVIDKSAIPQTYLNPYKPARSPNQSSRVEKRPMQPADNKAYLLHLKNHNKYATVKNYANFSKCPICQVFQNGYTGVYPPPAPVNLNAPNLSYQPFPGVPVASPSRQRKSYEPDNKYNDYLEETKEPDAVYVKVLKDREPRAQQELRVRKNEFLRVLDSSGNWWACEDKHGNGGYVPKNFLQHETREVIKEAERSSALRRSSEMPHANGPVVERDLYAQKRHSEMLPQMGWRGH